VEASALGPHLPIDRMVANGVGAQALVKAAAAEGGGRRPAFTVASGPAKIDPRIDGLGAVFRRRGSPLGREAVPADGALNIAETDDSRVREFGESDMCHRMR